MIEWRGHDDFLAVGSVDKVGRCCDPADDDNIDVDVVLVCLLRRHSAATPDDEII
jgi:hypothetical protein